MSDANLEAGAASRSPTVTHNARAWDNLARRQISLARPAADADFASPLRTVDPLGWLGPQITGLEVLCLAGGGGRQSALYAAAGAHVTVVDVSAEMLALDRAVAAHRKLNLRCVQGSMTDLSMLADREFDIVIHPVSTCYVADLAAVFGEVARVTRGGGIYVSQHKSPVSLQTNLLPDETGYHIREPYYCEGPLPTGEPSRVREAGTLEFLHRWEELVGGICRAGFVIEDLVEPLHADPAAEVGTFGHRGQFIAPYVRIKARRCDPRPSASIVHVE